MYCISKIIYETKKIVNNKLNTYLEKYNKAYFDKRHFWITADLAWSGTKEHAYYKLINSLFSL